MSLDMLKIVCAAEDESRQAVLFAKQNAQNAINEVHNAGKESIVSTKQRAKTEIAHLLRASDQKATEQAKELASVTATKLATGRARAEKRLEDAANFIVERIVNI